MSIVVVGSVAFDTIETPVGKVDRVLGGSANYFSLASSFFTSVKMVGVVGSDFPQEHFDFLKSRNICQKGYNEFSTEILFIGWGVMMPHLLMQKPSVHS